MMQAHVLLKWSFAITRTVRFVFQQQLVGYRRSRTHLEGLPTEGMEYDRLRSKYQGDVPRNTREICKMEDPLQLTKFATGHSNAEPEDHHGSGQSPRIQCGVCEFR
jgi:hypothetical protein